MIVEVVLSMFNDNLLPCSHSFIFSISYLSILFSLCKHQSVYQTVDQGYRESFERGAVRLVRRVFSECWLESRLSV